MREHVTGFRSHTTMLAGGRGIAAIVVARRWAPAWTLLPVLLVGGVVAFGGGFYGLRELFKRRSGGLSFR